MISAVVTASLVAMLGMSAVAIARTERARDALPDMDSVQARASSEAAERQLSERFHKLEDFAEETANLVNTISAAKVAAATGNGAVIVRDFAARRAR